MSCSAELKKKMFITSMSGQNQAMIFYAKAPLTMSSDFVSCDILVTNIFDLIGCPTLKGQPSSIMPVTPLIAYTSLR